MTTYIDFIGTETLFNNLNDPSGNIQTAADKLWDYFGQLDGVNYSTVAWDAQADALSLSGSSVQDRRESAHDKLDGGDGPISYNSSHGWVVIDYYDNEYLACDSILGAASQGTAGTSQDHTALVDYRPFAEACNSWSARHKTVAHEAGHLLGACHNDYGHTQDDEATFMHTGKSVQGDCFDNGTPSSYLYEWSYCAEHYIEQKMENIDSGSPSVIDCQNDNDGSGAY